MTELTLPEREHAKACPGDRVESFVTQRTVRNSDGSHSKEDVTVVRCIDCGGQTTYDGAHDDGEEETDADDKG